MMVAGLPLMAYTILLANKLPNAGRVIVNTDNPCYAEIARHYGAEVPFLRPTSISRSDSSIGDAVRFTIQRLAEEAYPVKKLVTLYPTSPFRNLKDLSDMIDSLDFHRQVKTVMKVNTSWRKMCFSKHRNLELVDRYIVNHPSMAVSIKAIGYCIGSNRDADFNGLEKTKFYTISNPLELIDVNTLGDLELAEKIVEHQMYDFGTELC
jgi:CMP-N-acetylneuraminic acid synthetase